MPILRFVPLLYYAFFEDILAPLNGPKFRAANVICHIFPIFAALSENAGMGFGSRDTGAYVSKGGRRERGEGLFSCRNSFYS